MADAIVKFFEKKLKERFKKEMKKKEHIFEWTKDKEESFFG
jgi:hypothetical protein